MTLIGIAFLLICVLFIFMLITISKINSIHKKVTDVSPNDLYPFMEEMRELVIESERVADKLEDAVRQKEEMLEDLAALVDEKLKRLETIQDEEPPKRMIPRPAARPEYDDIDDSYDTYAPTMQPQPNPSGVSIREQISDLVLMGLSDNDIATKLNVSITEVQLVKRMSAD
jgi:ATP/maltotriose-dependent transcriptional regulator MalT